MPWILLAEARVGRFREEPGRVEGLVNLTEMVEIRVVLDIVPGGSRVIQLNEGGRVEFANLGQ